LALFGAEGENAARKQIAETRSATAEATVRELATRLLATTETTPEAIAEAGKENPLALAFLAVRETARGESSAATKYGMEYRRLVQRDSPGRLGVYWQVVSQFLSEQTALIPAAPAQTAAPRQVKTSTAVQPKVASNQSGFAKRQPLPLPDTLEPSGAFPLVNGTYLIRSRLSGLYLQARVAKGNPASGNVVELGPLDPPRQEDQQWRITPAQDTSKTYRIAPINISGALTATDSEKGSGSKLVTREVSHIGDVALRTVWIWPTIQPKSFCIAFIGGTQSATVVREDAQPGSFKVVLGAFQRGAPAQQFEVILLKGE
jgi:hypothetical protein